MRAAAALSALAFLIVFQATLVAQEFPYTVTAADRAPLRASANETNEPTTYLQGGTKLEVYAREGNFLAVRPPEGSFSWVRASDVAATGDADIVRVAVAGSQAWVGHQGTDLRAVSQVQLQAGEKLRVLGAIASANNPTIAAWYQIAPPAGEFRFILEQHVQPDAPAPVASQPTFTAPVQLASFTAPASDAAVAPPSEAAAQAAAAPAVFSPPAVASAAPPVSAAPLTSALGLNVDVMPSAAANPVAERLKQIDAQLAAMLAQPPSTWNTTALYSELQTLTSTAPTPELRTQAQGLWWRVAKCQQVQQGYAQISTPMVAPRAPTTTPATTTLPPAQLAPPVAQASATATINPVTGQPLVTPTPESDLQPLVSRLRKVADQLSANAQQQRQYSSRLRNRNAPSPELADASEQATRSVLAAAVTEEPAADPVAEAGGYAGTGWLMPLVNRSQLSREGRSGVPPFALTDDEGNVKFLVTPTPGLNVSEYARKKVGIVGPVGQLPNLSNPHLTAQRVVVLDRHD